MMISVSVIESIMRRTSASVTARPGSAVTPDLPAGRRPFRRVDDLVDDVP
jgi:hypothetical protein